jgi:hypothetical protein
MSAPTAFLLAEAALELVLRAGPAAIAVYLIGVLPFTVGLLGYWAAMVSSAHASLYASAGALGLALLFIWMKVFQNRYAQHLRAALEHEGVPPWSGFFTVLCRQAAIHATLVMVYPVCFVTLLPMGFAIAWYQNVTVMDHAEIRGMRELMRQAFEEAKRWPRQNHLLLWLCSPLMVLMGVTVYLGTFPVLDGLMLPGVDDSWLLNVGYVYSGILLLAILPLAPFPCLVVINIASGLFFATELFHILTGADTAYARNPWAIFGNTTFIAVCGALTFLLLDPIIKAAYTIRCYQGAAQQSGADLRLRLVRLRKRAQQAAALLALAAAALGHAAPAHAQAIDESRVTSLDSALDQELAGQKYVWRMPREPHPDVEMPWLLRALSDLGQTIRDAVKKVIQSVFDFIEWILDWIRGDSDGGLMGSSDRSFNPSLRVLVALLVAALIALSAYFLWRYYRTRIPVETLQPMMAAPEAPDIESEATTAAELPEDEWFRLARELAEKGEYRLAARALFFSMLATLAQRDIIRIARFKSNMDYGNEIARRAAILGDAPQYFARGALVYESVWYGEHPATPDTLNELAACQERLRDGTP